MEEALHDSTETLRLLEDPEVLLMRTFEKLSYEEIGYVLGIDRAAARKRHGRALLRLDKILREGGMTESQI